MESDTSDKKTSFEELSKDDIVKKYNNLLIIAKKAKQSKDEALQELRKTRSENSELISTVAALQEVVESLRKKQKQFEEVESTLKTSEEKNVILKNSIYELEDQYARKATECVKLQEELKILTEELNALKEKHSEALKKFDDLKENHAKIDIENKMHENKLALFKNENSSVCHPKILEENERLRIELQQKATETNVLNKKIEELHEKLKIFSENKIDINSKNIQLKNCNEKSTEYAKVSEKLIKEEEENLKLMEEISELKKKEKESEKKFHAFLEEKNKVVEELKKQLNSLENKLEKATKEKMNLENFLRNQELEESLPGKENPEREKGSLNETTENLQKCWEEEQIQHSRIQIEKANTEKNLVSLSSDMGVSAQKWKVVQEEQQMISERKEKKVEELREELNIAERTLGKLENDCSTQDMVNYKEALDRRIEEIKINYYTSIDNLYKKLDKVFVMFTTVKELRTCFEMDLKKKLKGFQSEQNEVRQKIEEVLLKYISQLYNGNSELLSEMNVMNQVLKERGETISKLEQLTENQRKDLEEATVKINNQNSKLQERNKKLEEMEEEIQKAKQEAESKHQAMREMEEEIWRIRNNEQGEALSSSTLSRAEESSRLMELEESFEERYSKLKVIAVKLKKKVTELQKQVEAERNRLITAEAEYQNKVANFHNQIKSLRNIQTEYDALLDVLDEEKKKKIALEKRLDLTQQELISLKREFEEVRLDKEKHKSQKNSFEKIKKELTAHIGELKLTVEKHKSEYSQLEKQMEEIKNLMVIKDRHIEEEKAKHMAVMQILEEQKQDSKKHSVLELEIAAYEKTAEDLKKRLDNKEKQVIELKNNLESEIKLRESKEEEIVLLKSKIAEEQFKVDDCSRQLKQLSEDLNTQRLEMQKKIDIIRTIEKNAEEKNLKIESLSLELEAVFKEKFKEEAKCRNNEDKLRRQVHTLEEKSASAQDMLCQKEMELEELKKEFQAYKVRAQSVLRQSQKEVNPSKQQNALEELEQLKSTTESLKIRLEESNRKLQKLVEENGTLLEEKKKLFERVQDLNSLVAALRDENQILKEVKQKENEEHAEALRIQKLQADTLAQCFQRQIEELKAENASQIQELRKEKQKQEKESNVSTMLELKQSSEMETPNNNNIFKAFIPVKPDKEVLDVMFLEREECEGSESVDSTSPQTGTNLIPLEKLLNESEDSERHRKTSQDANQLKSLLEKSENRIRHLTLLLAEAETDSARLNQLNEILKEEIRRHQRSLEREKHAQNFEYLKNVILKFISLQNVDEKLRLVPVLNTILKLSPDEEHLLTNCAKGTLDTGNKGWSNYLSIWSGG